MVGRSCRSVPISNFYHRDRLSLINGQSGSFAPPFFCGHLFQIVAAEKLHALENAAVFDFDFKHAEIGDGFKMRGDVCRGRIAMAAHRGI